MCTIGFHKKLNIIFKNRDKSSITVEEIIKNDNIIACKTKDENYYSWGLNKYGVAFVSARINSPLWTGLIYDGLMDKAKEQYALENKNLINPVIKISEKLHDIKETDYLIELLKSGKNNSMGYNVLIADNKQAYILELYKDEISIEMFNENRAITNHFQKINSGPKKEEDYKNSFERYSYSNSIIKKSESLSDIFDMLQSGSSGKDNILWRNDIFHTVSSTIIDFNEKKVYFLSANSDKYSIISF